VEGDDAEMTRSRRPSAIVAARAALETWLPSEERREFASFLINNLRGFAEPKVALEAMERSRDQAFFAARAVADLLVFRKLHVVFACLPLDDTRDTSCRVGVQMESAIEVTVNRLRDLVATRPSTMLPKIVRRFTGYAGFYRRDRRFWDVGRRAIRTRVPHAIHSWGDLMRVESVALVGLDLTSVLVVPHPHPIDDCPHWLMLEPVLLTTDRTGDHG
jgi:hypothetical protein